MKYKVLYNTSKKIYIFLKKTKSIYTKKCKVLYTKHVEVKKMNLKNKILTNKKHYYGDNIIISVEEAACFAGAGEKAVKLVTADGDVFVRWDEIETKANKYAKAIFNHFQKNLLKIKKIKN